MRIIGRTPVGPLAGLLVIGHLLPPGLAAQEKRYVPGQVIVLLEPNAISMPAGARRATGDRISVAAGEVREIVTIRRLKGARKIHPAWSATWPVPEGLVVRERRKGDALQPNELTDLSHYYVLEFPDTTDVPSLVAELNKAAGVVHAEPNYFIESTSIVERRPRAKSKSALLPPPVPNDPGFSGNWGLRNLSTPSADINALEAWELQSGASPIRIAILDAGIDDTHGDFGPGNAGGKVVASYDFVHDDANTSPDLNIRSPYHGTAVSAIAAAETNDGVGVAGVCGGFGQTPGCSILDAKILGTQSLAQGFAEWLGTTDIAAAAVNWAVTNGAKVINNSWCNTADGLLNEFNFTTHDALRNAYHQGVLITATMGNSDGSCDQDSPSEIVSPGAFTDFLMPVGAIRSNGQRVTMLNNQGVWESAFGPHISVVAPGHSIQTDQLDHRSDLSFSGTSAAAPFVAGLAGLIFSEAQEKGLALSPLDVRRIIELTAQDREASGHDQNTGWGLIDAAKALQVLQAPNRLSFASAGGTSSTCHTLTSVQNWAFLSDRVVFRARRCEIRRTVNFANTYVTPPLVWGRPVTGGGITASNPNSQVLSTSVVPGTVTTTGVTLRTYVYERWSLTGTYQGWYPRAPSSGVTFAYGVLGDPGPFVVTAGAPRTVTVKASYSLTGSASHPATGWDWDRSDNGGSTWSQWAITQNSSFVAFAGNYTINWRLAARRVLDNVTDTHLATTDVCTTGSCPAQLHAATSGLLASRSAQATSGPAHSTVVQVAASSTNIVVAGDHFGAGPLISQDGSADSAVIQFYSLAEGRDLASSDGTVTNSFTISPGEKRRRTSVASGQALSLEETRTVPLPGASAIQLAFTGLAKSASHRVSFALDPDLGDQAGDDQVAWIDSAGIAVVSDRTGRSVAYTWLSPPSGARSSLLEFASSAGWQEPVDPVELFRDQRAPTRVTNQSGDVRFILTVGPVGSSAAGRLSATLLTATGPTLGAALVSLQEAREKVVAGIASGPTAAVSTTPRVFALRQSLNGQRSGSLGDGTSAAISMSPRVQLRKFGLTALDYVVADGESVDVTIQVFSNTGRLVRTLLKEHRAPGDYHIEWDGLNERGQRVAPGVYTAVMSAGSFKARRKLVITH